MLLADGGGGSSADYIKSVGEAALKAGKTVSEDIAFNAEGFDKVINRLEDVIDAQAKRKRMARAGTERAFTREEAEDWASDYYAGRTGDFDEKYETWNDKYVERLKQTVEKFKKVKAHYMAREDEIGEQFRSGMNK